MTLLRTVAHGISERLYSWNTSAISSGGAGDPLPVEDDLPMRRAHQTGDALEQRRLPAAGRADHAHELAGLDRERDAAIASVAFAPAPYVLPTSLISSIACLAYCGVAARQPRCQARKRRSARR